MMKARASLTSLAFMSVLAVVWACTQYEVKSQTGPAFTAKAQSIIFDRCIACHAGGQAEGGLGFIDKPELLFKEGYVIPGDPDNSMLFQKISASPLEGDRMPLGGPYLTESQMEDIRDWIYNFKGLVKVSLSGSRVTLSESEAYVYEGSSFSVEVQAEGSATLQSAVESDCPEGTWNDSLSIYTVGPLTRDCSLRFKALKNLVVTAGRGENIAAVTPEGAINSNEEKTLEFSVTPADGYVASAAGTCPTGTWSDGRYTTGQLVDDCTVTFTGGKYAVSISSTPIAVDVAGERQIGATTLSLVPTIAVKAAVASSVTSNPQYVISQTVGGTCPQGTWSGTTYTTGVIQEDCSVVFNVENPCPTAIANLRFSDIQSIMSGTNSISRGCMGASCHTNRTDRASFGTTSTVAYSVMMDRNVSSTVSGTIKYNSTYGNNQTTGGHSVEPRDPLNSWLYRKVSTSWLGGQLANNGNGRMPRNASFQALSDAEISKICNWIWDGAPE